RRSRFSPAISLSKDKRLHVRCSDLLQQLTTESRKNFIIQVATNVAGVFPASHHNLTVISLCEFIAISAGSEPLLCQALLTSRRLARRNDNSKSVAFTACGLKAHFRIPSNCNLFWLSSKPVSEQPRLLAAW